MTARVLDGRELATHLRRDLTHRVERLVERSDAVAPGLAIVRDPSVHGAALYAASLERAARSVGIPTRLLDAASPSEPLDPLVGALNDDPSISGIVVAQPFADVGAGRRLVERLDLLVGALNDDPSISGIVVAQPFADVGAGRRLVERLDPEKDVDGATPTNAGRLARGEPAHVPATALAVIAILEAAGIDVAGRRAVIVGRSAVVGRPLASLLLARDATITVCHRGTRDLATETRRAELLVAAAGSPGLIGAEMVHEASIVIDCGINAIDGAIVGDVDFEAVAGVAAAITPVPGGVGPVTPMMVLRQTVETAERRQHADALIRR